jgi:hypothetical protein
MTGGWIWILLPLSWYITVIPTWENNPVVAGILHNDSQSAAGLWSILLGNLVSVLPEILVNYAALPLFLYGFWIMRERHVRTDARYMLLLSVSFSVAAYFFFEMHLIATNHDYYLFPFLPLIMLISTAGALSLLSTKTGRIFLTVCMLILPVTAFRRMDSRWDMERPGFNKDLIEFADRIRNIIPENDRIFCAGDPSGNIWFYYLDRKGWNSMYNADMQFIRDKKGLGAKWIVTDRRSYLDSLANDPMLRIDTASISQFNSFCVAPMK